MIKQIPTISVILACTMLMLCGCSGISSLRTESQLREGDLLFHVTASGNMITDVTKGKSGRQIDHVAIYYKDREGRGMVVHAKSAGVITTPLDSLMAEPGYYITGRVRGADTSTSVSKAKTHIGKAYDYVYANDDSEIYCSELVLLSYRDKRGRKIFGPIGMTFRDVTGQIPQYWTDFYAQRGMAVPEGAPGSNPGELSRRKKVRIMYDMRDFAKLRLQESVNY